LSLLGKFNAVGLRDAYIAKDTVYALDAKNLRIEINIDEGKKYFFGDIAWTGNTKYRSSFLDSVLGIKTGDMYNKSLFVSTPLRGRRRKRHYSFIHG